MIVSSSLHVLVIDDDEDTQENLRDILELDDYVVTTASTVAEALNRDNWQTFSAILLDRRLPDGSAEELLPRLTQLAPKAAIIIVTGHADLDGAINAMRHGAFDYITKPINADLIRSRLHNVAQRKRAEAEIARLNEQALQNERLAAIGQMMTGLAHESGNALARSQACLEMLTFEVENQPKALNLITRIQQAQDHLKQLYEEVRNYAAPLKLQVEPWNLASIWRQAWENLQVMREDKKATLVEEFVGVDLRCHVDQFRLGQVYRNVFENSLAACAEPVEVKIVCVFGQLGAKRALRISIQDNGPGLNDEQRQRIFDPFFTTKTKGTGLGMAIAKRIVEAHGGQIAVGSGSPRGAEILITLPVEKP